MTRPGTVLIYRCAWAAGTAHQDHDTEGAAERQRTWLSRQTPPVVAHVYAVTVWVDEGDAA